MNLGDLGERRILREIISRFSASSGDDCESVEVDSGSIVLTTDPVPPPAASVIGRDDDPYWAGWLLVTINASDVAASGADPIAFLAAAEFPADQSVSGFERFLAGVRDACAEEGYPYSGGNLRESKAFSATGVAAGWVPAGSKLRRTGASDGDLIVSVGQGGLFWRDALLVRSGHTVDKQGSRLYRPVSQGRAMRALRMRQMIRASMDVSDGLVPTLSELARVNGLTAVLHPRSLVVPGCEAIIGSQIDDPAKLWLGWGDWTVVVAVSKEQYREAEQIAADTRTPLVAIGHFERGPGELVIEVDGSRCAAGRLESERFVKDSWFTSGIDGYIELLKNYELKPVVS